MTTRTWIVTCRAMGVLLVVAAGVGFLVVADDLRHPGELFGVGSILIAGLSLLAAAYSNPLSRRLAVQWLAPAVLIGAVRGAMIDDLLVGLAGGLMVGLCLAFMLRRRSLFRARR